jgi:hypothetical protein
MLWAMMWTRGQRVKEPVIFKIPFLRSSALLSTDPDQLTPAWKTVKPLDKSVLRIFRK